MVTLYVMGISLNTCWLDQLPNQFPDFVDGTDIVVVEVIRIFIK